MRSSAPLALLAALVASPAAGEYAPETNFVLHCQGCHGADGVGGVPDEVPPLAGSVGYFVRVPGGREYLAQVPGAANAPVSNAELAALLNFMLRQYSAAEAGDDFEPYTAQEITRIRRARPDVVTLRARLVAEIRARHGVQLWTDGYLAPALQP